MPLYVSSGSKLLTLLVATGGGICKMKVKYDMHPGIIIAITDGLPIAMYNIIFIHTNLSSGNNEVITVMYNSYIE